MQSLPLSPDAISPRWRNTCYTISNWLPSNILLNLPHPSDSRRAENPPWRFQRITHYLNGILQLNAILTLCVPSRCITFGYGERHIYLFNAEDSFNDNGMKINNNDYDYSNNNNKKRMIMLVRIMILIIISLIIVTIITKL